jgi:2-amino-4-hydroxy-6-hydroxymethyldihydropteridine diphosphokinase
MILLGLGSNRNGAWGTPAATLDRAVLELAAAGLAVTARSSWYSSAPYGRTDQAAFVNGVVAVHSHAPPLALLWRCREFERRSGRDRRLRWGPRTLDIDLLAYHDVLLSGPTSARESALRRIIPLIVPHPGIPDRPFVLAPIREFAPFWHHPVTGETAHGMLAKLSSQSQGAILRTL